MSIDKLLEGVTPEIYQRMQSAIATGKWPNGVALNEEQQAHCLQIVIAYDEKNKSTEDRVGYLPTKPKDSPRRSDMDPQPMRIIEDQT